MGSFKPSKHQIDAVSKRAFSFAKPATKIPSAVDGHADFLGSVPDNEITKPTYTGSYTFATKLQHDHFWLIKAVT